MQIFTHLDPPLVPRTNRVTERDGPVIKKEHLGHYYTPTPPSTCEYSGKTAYSNEADLFHRPRPQQRPIEIHLAAQLKQADASGDSPPLFLARARLAERHVTDSASYLTVMPSRSASQGFHLGASNQTSTNERQAPNAESRVRQQLDQDREANRYVAQHEASPPHFRGENSIVRHQHEQYVLNSHDQTSATYEALRHGSTGSYQPSVAAFSPYHQSPHFYPYTAAMSLSYETRTFPDYPQSAMMHDPHQEQDDNSIQHHRYPSPPPPLSENPYNPQTMDATTALAMDEMPELPPKEESDAPSPGRSKPIPKPDREVTKGEDGRFVCNWAGCTEEVRSFNRKCEWSKVCALLLQPPQNHQIS